MPKVGFHHSAKTKEKLRQLAIGVVRSDEYKVKMSEATKRHWDSPIGKKRRAKYSEMLHGDEHPMYGKQHTKASKKLMRRAKLGGTLSEVHKHKISIASKCIGISPETRYKMGLSLRVTRKAQWQDPDYVLKQTKARGVYPNKSEKVLEDILLVNFPQFRYNGDGRLEVVLAGMIPDYVNVNGKKQVIELFGELYHDPNVAKRANRKVKWNKTLEGRLQSYKNIGWDCLIIWGLELKHPAQVKQKIAEFVNG